MTVALLILDLLLLVVSTARLYRLVWTDHLGQVLLQEPAQRQLERLEWSGRVRLSRFLQAGLECPFCLGFWIGAIWLGVLLLAGGPGEAALWWRYVAGALALNWAAAHLAGRSGDL